MIAFMHIALFALVILLPIELVALLAYYYLHTR